MRDVAERGLCDLAPDNVLDKLTADGARPEWAARITPLGRTVLTYRELQENPDPTTEPATAPEGLKVRGTDIDILRSALASAEADALPGIDAPALRNALAGAVPVPGSRQHPHYQQGRPRRGRRCSPPGVARAGLHRLPPAPATAAPVLVERTTWATAHVFTRWSRRSVTDEMTSVERQEATLPTQSQPQSM